MIAIVEYRFGSYEDTIDVYCEDDDTDETIIKKAMEKLKEQLKGDIPDTWQYWRVLRRF